MKHAVEIERRVRRDVYVARCPLHHEVTPSVRVLAVVGDWHCLSCGAGGAVAYLQRDDAGRPVRAILEGVE